MSKYVFDTNALLSHLYLLDMDGVHIIPEIVLQELDKLKIGKTETALQAREAVRKLKSKDKIIYDHRFGRKHELFSSNIIGNDDLIIECAKENNAILVTGDYIVQLKAKALNIELLETDLITDNNKYDGFIEILATDEELSETYQNLDYNKWNLLDNQYLIIKNKDTGEIIDSLKWFNNTLHRVQEKSVKSQLFGKLTPYDYYQKCAIDSIYSNPITCIKGSAGSGKSLISLYTSWSLIEKGKYDKLIIFTNPTKTKNAEALGFYKGTRTEKLLDSQIGIMLSSKVGDKMQLDLLINQGVIELLPFSDIRGFDTTSEKKTILWITEAQNLDNELLKLGLQRVGENTKVIVDGDPYTQVDKEIYRTNNGMLKMSEVFRGNDIYGEVTLNKIYRSRIAEIADRM